MKITTFTSKITKKEGLKVSINNAQMAEAVKLIDIATKGALKKEIKKIPEESELF